MSEKTRTPTPPSRMRRTSLYFAGVNAVCVLAFAAHGTYEVTQQLGITSSARWAWLMPCALEAGAVSATLLADRRARAGESTRMEYGTLVALGLLAAWVQVTHTTGVGERALTPALAVAPVLTLLVLAHLLLRSLRADEAVAAREREEAAALAAAARVERARSEVRERARERRAERALSNQPSERSPDRGDAQTVNARSDRTGDADGALTRAERAPRVDAMYAKEGDELTGVEVAERLGVSGATARRDLADARVRAREISTAA